MSKDAYYFSHDANAFSDPKIQRLVMSHGIEGYAFFFICIEMMRNEKDYMIDNDADSIAYHMRIDVSNAQAMLKKCLSIALFDIDGDKLFSTSFLRRMESADKLRNKRIEAGRKGGKVSKAQAPLKQNVSNAEALKERKGKETKVKETKEPLSGSDESQPDPMNDSHEPLCTVQEIGDQLEYKKFNRSGAQHIYDKFCGCGWMGKKGSIKCWKSTMTKWFLGKPYFIKLYSKDMAPQTGRPATFKNLGAEGSKAGYAKYEKIQAEQEAERQRLKDNPEPARSEDCPF